MAFSFKSRYKYRAQIDITPLIDLSFNLILFFMVTYSIGNISAITVHLPRAVQAGGGHHDHRRGVGALSSPCLGFTLIV